MSRAARLLATLLIVVAGTQPAAAQRYDPRLRFRTLATAHFDIYFHQGEDALARRLGVVAEQVAGELEPRLGRPSHRVRVVLVDQTDLSNGWATPLPYNLIELTAAPPPGSSIIGNTGDWLRLVFTHEYTHILHLDRSRGLFRGLRSVFGRAPFAYPNLALPLWQIEGIATYQESAATGEGRVRAGEARAIVARAADAGAFVPLDRASTWIVDWPSGNTPYLYGGYFHQYLATRFGPDAIARLADATAGRVPYFGAPAFKKVFGRSLDDLWSDFENDMRRREGVEAETRRRLTRHGFTVTAPRFTGEGRLFYSVANPHGFPSLMERVGDDGPRTVVTRYLGNRLATAGQLLVFDQLEYVRSAGLQSDLYAVTTEGRGLRRLTRGARASDPDVAPDGRTIACAVQSGDRRVIATMPLPPDGRTGTPTPLVSQPFTDFAAPRWSPDGRSIVAERRRVGAPPDLVLVDVSTGTVRPLVAFESGRAVSPTWLPDGRTVLFSSDREGPFTLFAVDAHTGLLRRVSGAGAGAQSAVLSPDRRTLVFVGYSVEGYDLYAIPFDERTWEDAGTAATPAAAAPATPAPAVLSIPDAPYRPWSTLLPRFWTPLVETDDGEWQAGAATGGMDALGRHAYGATVAWAASRGRPDWLAAYAYGRWRPTLFAQASGDTDPFRDGEVRSSEWNAGSLLAVRRVRWTSSIFAALHGSTDTVDCAGCDPGIAGVSKRRAVRLGWSVDGAKRYGYSISDEEGGTAIVTAEVARRGFGSDGHGTSLALDLRKYARAVPRHGVLAARIAAAAAWGDEGTARIFSAGGSGQPGGGFGFGLDAVGLLRGFDEGDLFGRRAAVVNLDYRVPLARVERGVGTLPFFLRVVHGSVFVDIGHAWTGRLRAGEIRKSFGAELAADTIVGYSLPITLVTGAAWLDDPTGARRGWTAFTRIGRAF